MANILSNVSIGNPIHNLVMWDGMMDEQGQVVFHPNLQEIASKYEVLQSPRILRNPIVPIPTNNPVFPARHLHTGSAFSYQ